MSMDATPPLVPPPMRDPAALRYAAWEAPARRYRPDASPAVAVRFTRLAHTDRLGDRDDGGAAVAELVGPDGTLHPFPQFLAFDDADALEWGYFGGGPTVTSAQVLALVLFPKEAWRLRHEFVQDVVGWIPRDGGELPMARVRAWVEAWWAAERADPERMAREAGLREAAGGEDAGGASGPDGPGART